jgi:hypothetical protein
MPPRSLKRKLADFAKQDPYANIQPVPLPPPPLPSSSLESITAERPHPISSVPSATAGDPFSHLWDEDPSLELLLGRDFVQKVYDQVEKNDVLSQSKPSLLSATQMNTNTSKSDKHV